MTARVEISLHRAQMIVRAARARFKVVVAGRRWGKTHLSRAVAVEAAAAKRGSRVWYIAPSYRMAKQIMWEDLKRAIPPAWVKKINETEMSVLLINGARVECKGADDPDSLRGVGLWFAILDEFQDIKFDVWTKVIRPTLAKDRGGALFIGTPKGFENIYKLYELGQNPDYKMWKSWQFPTHTSPFIPRSEIEAARTEMDEKSFRQEFLASFETMSGRVYYAFDRKAHVGDYPFNPNLPIWVGSDFNMDPMCSVILQPQLDGSVWVVDEIFLRDSNVLEVCEELERRYWRQMLLHPLPITIYPDPAGKYGQHARGESSLDIYREKGFRRILHRRKHPPVADRVTSVNRMLRDAAGNIKLRVNKSCVNLITSLEQTLYKEGTNEVDKRPGIEHMTDALGYPVEYEFPAKQVRIAGISI